VSDIDTQALPTDEPAATDTSTQVDQSEASTQNNEAPGATQSTEEQTSVNATDTVEEKLYAGKYKTPEEMEQAYKSLESKYGQTSSEKAELSKILNQAFAEPATPLAPAAEESFEESNPLNQEIENLKRQTAVQGFVMNHQDADAATMGKILAEDPIVKQISGHEAKLEYAYLKSQNMTTSKAIAEAQKSGAQAAQAKIAEKQVAQVEAAQKTEPINDSSDLMEKATGNYSQEDRDKARKALIRKNLVNL
jgi:hypothetical protein